MAMLMRRIPFALQVRLCVWTPMQLAGMALAIAALPVTRGLFREAAERVMGQQAVTRC